MSLVMNERHRVAIEECSKELHLVAQSVEARATKAMAILLEELSRIDSPFCQVDAVFQEMIRRAYTVAFSEPDDTVVTGRFDMTKEETDE